MQLSTSTNSCTDCSGGLRIVAHCSATIAIATCVLSQLCIVDIDHPSGATLSCVSAFISTHVLHVMCCLIRFRTSGCQPDLSSGVDIAQLSAPTKGSRPHITTTDGHRWRHIVADAPVAMIAPVAMTGMHTGHDQHEPGCVCTADEHTAPAVTICEPGDASECATASGTIVTQSAGQRAPCTRIQCSRQASPHRHDRSLYYERCTAYHGDPSDDVLKTCRVNI